VLQAPVERIQHVGPLVIERIGGDIVLLGVIILILLILVLIRPITATAEATGADPPARGELVRVEPRGAGGFAGFFDPGLDVGLELFAEKLGEDVFLGAAGEVGGGMDGEALKDAGVFGEELLDGADVLLQDAGGGLEGFSGNMEGTGE
jgi:ABC-type cobalt transport system substrate-binding protein